MPRSRNVKPGFFKNELLVELPFSTRLLFAGLWTLADREGRLEDRPKKIKMEIFPADDVDVDAGLDALRASGFILRYVVNGRRYIQIIEFLKHQTPHHREVASVIPQPEASPELHPRSKAAQPEAPPAKAQVKPEAEPGQGPGEPVPSRSDSLVLIPDSLVLIPDSLIPEEKPLRGGAKKSQAKTRKKVKTKKSQKPSTEAAPSVAGEEHKGNGKSNGKTEPKTAAVWQAYSEAYEQRYSTPPIRNALVNGQLSHFCDRVHHTEAHFVAAFYVRSNRAIYVSNGHSIGLLLRDAENLRTQWFTGIAKTDTEARQTDRMGATANAFAPLIAEAEERERQEERNGRK